MNLRKKMGMKPLKECRKLLVEHGWVILDDWVKSLFEQQGEFVCIRKCCLKTKQEIETTKIMAPFLFNEPQTDEEVYVAHEEEVKGRSDEWFSTKKSELPKENGDYVVYLKNTDNSPLKNNIQVCTYIKGIGFNTPFFGTFVSLWKHKPSLPSKM